MLETLIATALMVAILGALATVTGQWLPSWNRGFGRVQQAELAALGLDRLLADLAAAEFVSSHGEAKAPLFDGAELAVTFVRSALGPSTSPGLEVVRIAQTRDQKGPALVRLRTRFLPADTGIESRLGDPVVLLRAPYSVSFSYAGEDRMWRTSWREEMLPSAVRVQVRNAATSQILAVSSATLVHINAPADCVRSKTPERCGEPQGAAGQPGQPAAAPPAAGQRPL